MGLSPEHEKALESIRALYNDDKLLQCARLLKPLQELVAQPSPQSVSPQEVAALKAALSTADLARIQKECAEVSAFKEALNDSTGWTLSYGGAETKVWYRREPNTSTHSLRIEGVIRAPLLNIAALLYEADLYRHLFWYVLESTVLRTPPHATLLRRATHILAFAPWPLNNRDVALYAYAVDALGGDGDDDDSVLVVSRSIRDTDEIADVPDVARGVVRAQFNNSGIELRPKSPGETDVRFLYNVDPQLGFLPMPLVNWGARFMCRWSLRVLESRARNLGAVSPVYEERMEKGAVYVRIRQRLDEYWAAKGKDVNDQGSVSTGRPSADFNPDAKVTGPSKTLMLTLGRGKS